ncbi:MAG: thiamine phosphate synthase [Candidatus Omnitrophota bacterium]
MSSRKNPASSWMLYCILDGETIKQKNPVNTARFLFKSGVGVVQLRYKNIPSYKLLRIAKKIRRLARKYGRILLINDRADLALVSGTDGVHAGSGDMPIKTMRRLLKPGSIIGKTVHSVKAAKRATREKIDYVSAGPVFSTPFKPSLRPKGVNFIKKIKKSVTVPTLAIGGINSRNAKAVLQSGADGVCVTRVIFEAKKIIKEIS